MDQTVRQQSPMNSTASSSQIQKMGNVWGTRVHSIRARCGSENQHLSHRSLLLALNQNRHFKSHQIMCSVPTTKTFVSKKSAPATSAYNRHAQWQNSCWPFRPSQNIRAWKKIHLVHHRRFHQICRCCHSKKEATTFAQSIMDNWICCFGSPVQIHSDGGKEFVNELSADFFQLLDIKHTKTTPCHPQANAQVKVFNKTVAKYLASFVNESTLDWEVYIPAFMLSYNTSYHSTIMTACTRLRVLV